MTIYYTIIISLLALLLVVCIIKFSKELKHFYHSLVIWYEIRKAKKKLNKLNKGEMANDLQWDKKWFKK